MNKEERFEKLMFDTDTSSLSEKKFTQYIGELADTSRDLMEEEGLDRALKEIQEIEFETLSKKHRSLLNYYRGNIIGYQREINRNQDDEKWKWQDTHIEKEIVSFRKCIESEGFKDLSSKRKSQAYTNLGNCFSRVGRFVETINYYNEALKWDSQFPMAIGNKAICLKTYAQYLYDKDHRKILLDYSYSLLNKSLKGKNKKLLHPKAKKDFIRTLKGIESWFSKNDLELTDGFELEEYPYGNDEEEIKYRKWCIKNRLFLNPINDIGPFSISNQDVLHLPSLYDDLSDDSSDFHPPSYFGLFNQMKQEFVSARYLYYEGITGKGEHFSDKKVFLHDTLDYPEYSLNIEKTKMSFKMMYSILDKIGFFLNQYFSLDIPDKQVNFRRLWYKNEDHNQPLKTTFKCRKNYPLRGLFWLSKDIEGKEERRQAIDPSAREIRNIRNALEHRYLKLHTFDVGDEEKEQEHLFKDRFSYSLSRRDFEDKVLKTIKLTRAALIYLSLATNLEEMKKKDKIRKEGKIMPMGLPKYDLKRKK